MRSGVGRSLLLDVSFLKSSFDLFEALPPCAAAFRASARASVRLRRRAVVVVCASRFLVLLLVVRHTG